MKLVEQFIQSKTGNMDDCEDTYYYNDHFVAVIDGASNVSNQLINKQTPGQIAAHLIKDTIAGLCGEEPIQEIIQKINNNYRLLYKELNIYEEMKNKPYLRPSASMALFSKYYRKIWFIGDCQAYFDGKAYQNPKKVDEIFEEARSVFVKGSLLNGVTQKEILSNDDSFEYIKPFIQKQYSFQNKIPVCPLSYAVINGFHIPEQLIKTLIVPEDTDYISLATDGYRKIYSTLEKTEQVLEKLLKKDPLCIAENKGIMSVRKGQVSYDDRTYIKVKI